MGLPDVRISLSYHAGDGRPHTVEVDATGIARPADAARELGLAIRRTQGPGHVARRVCVLPQEGVTLDALTATVSPLGLAHADALYLNGYNSWTDSVERSPRWAMRGLVGVPPCVIDRWVLDGSGDYRFVEADALPGHQHGFGYGYVRTGALVTLVGSLDEDSGLTVLRERLRADALLLDKEVPVGTLPPGQEREVLSFALCEGTLDAAVSRWLSLARVRPRPCPPLVGFTSWYRHYGNISACKLARDLEEVGALLAERDLGECQAVFQVDDGYARVGDWLEPDAARFPEGMAPLAAALSERGLMPGIWLAPFLCELDSRVYREHQDWLLRDEGGTAVPAAGNWSGAVALDLLKPDVRAHVAHIMGTVTRTWGYRLLKLDFLFAACLVPHGGMNRGELMADALDLLRASVPEGTFFDLCGVPLLSAFGRTEYCRVGCDVGLDWDGAPYLRALHRERVSTRRSLANTHGRAHLDGRAFRNDPDVFFLRGDVRLTDAQRQALLTADAMLGGVLLTSDAVGEWGIQQRRAFERALETFVERGA